MKNAVVFLLMISAFLASCREQSEALPEPAYYYYARFEYMLDEGSHSTKVNAIITRDTAEREGEWDPAIGLFSVNHAVVNYSSPGYDWQVNGFTDGDVVFDSPGRTHFDHLFSSSDSLFNRLPAGTDTIRLSNYQLDIGTDSILQDEYLVLFMTQVNNSGKAYFHYDGQAGMYRISLVMFDELVPGPAVVQLSRRRHFSSTSVTGGTHVQCTYECRGEFTNVVILQ